MKKYINILILCLALIASNLVLPSEAAAASKTDRIVQPMYISINSFINTFDISSDGRAVVYSYLTTRDSDRQSISIYLEKYNNGAWSSVDSWSATSYSGTAYISDTIYVVHGQYRMRATGSSYKNGRLIEMSSYISQTIIY
ncbi:hypothetical protein I5677_04620 [Mobilitalea sibirica]|uniref:Uncharacterized protein n=1 Tax=Mobilitalea sibirica TaxID=1462919 RepID=A0A8J7L2A1_9FIRM|nr:hypothetical protein [Mobilitalea sibirica]MBH1940178.1 hypothetical protein [Mobilitalea sibirica]